jgi:endonuclease-3 related protein
MVTSSAAWPNGGRIVAALRARALLGPRKLATMPDRDVGRLIVSAGGDRRTAPLLGSFARWLVTRFGGRFDPLRRLPLAPLRAELLRVRGLGRETVDSILLYAAHRPVFVADLPVRRVLARHRVIRADADYETTRAFLEAHLPSDPALFNEMHALLVQVGRTYCSTPPRCGDCPLRGDLRNRPPARG